MSIVGKVLVVDDEEAVCRVLRVFLERRGLTVIIALCGDEAVEAYKRERPGLVFLDIRMPGKDGREVLREIMAFDPEASVAMLTAVYDLETSERALQEGAFAYITKPVDPEHLERIIGERLGGEP